MQSKLERIALGGGCFWCTEAGFKNIRGVVKVTAGYAGGTTANPTYEAVSRGNTGHAEVVLVEYDPEPVALEELLDVFFSMHDPATPNRQGNDNGTQYRSIILYTSEGQKAGIDEFLDCFRQDHDGPVVTQVEPLERFHPAEDYHQDYYERNPRQPYCRVVIAPKVEKNRNRPGTA